MGIRIIRNYNSNNQFWFHKDNNVGPVCHCSYLQQIFEVGGCYYIAGELRYGETITITREPFEAWLQDPNTLRSIKNAKGESIPGLSVNSRAE